MLPLFLKGRAVAFQDNFQGLVPKYAPQSGHPLEGSITFIVDRALREGKSISIKDYAQRLMSASLDRRLTLTNVEAEILRVAAGRGATVEFGSARLVDPPMRARTTLEEVTFASPFRLASVEGQRA